MQFNAPSIYLPSLADAINHSPLTVAPDTPLVKIIDLMERELQSVLLVMQLVGICTKGDVLRSISTGLNLTTSVIAEVMTQP